VPARSSRQRLASEDARRLDRLGQATFAPAASLRVAEEGAQGLGKTLDGAAGVTAFADPLDERLVDVGDGQIREGVSGYAEVVKELLDSRAVGIDRPRRQAPFAAEVVGESVNVVAMRARVGGKRLQAAQEAEPGGGMLEK
jgi:hypothetical protein